MPICTHCREGGEVNRYALSSDTPHERRHFTEVARTLHEACEDPGCLCQHEVGQEIDPAKDGGMQP